MDNKRQNVVLMRELNGWSRDDLAAKIGLTSVSIWRIESGKQQLTERTQKQLEQIFGVNLDDPGLASKVAEIQRKVNQSKLAIMNEVLAA